MTAGSKARCRKLSGVRYSWAILRKASPDGRRNCVLNSAFASTLPRTRWAGLAGRSKAARYACPPDVRLQCGLDPDGAAPDRAASEPLGGVAHVLDHFLFAEDRAHMGHLTRFVVEKHAIEQHSQAAKGEYREGDGGDELAVDARGDELDQWKFCMGNSLSEERACWRSVALVTIR